MKFVPKTEDDALKAAVRRALLEAGVYDGVLLSVIEKLSKAENEMFVAKIGIHTADGVIELTDYVTGSEQSALRLRHLASACGPETLALYEKATLSASDFKIGTPLRVTVGIEKATKKYRARNCCEDFAAPEVAGVVTPLVRMTG